MLRFIFYVNIFKGIILSAVSQHGSRDGKLCMAGEALPWMCHLGFYGVKKGCGPPRAMVALLLTPMEAGGGCRPSPTTLHHSSAPCWLFIPFTPFWIKTAAVTLRWARSILQLN